MYNFKLACFYALKGKFSNNLLPKRTNKGFTIIELVVVIVVMGILSAIGISSFSSIRTEAKNTQKLSQITVISEALEDYFVKNGSYPSCAAITTSSNIVVTDTLKGLNPEILTAPGVSKGTNSLSCDEPIETSFGYIGGETEYTLKYKEDGGGNIVALDSRYHAVTATYTLTIVAESGGTVNSGGTYAAGTTQTISANPSLYYSFTNWTGSSGCSGLASHTITMDSNKTCTANFTPTTITIPSVPVVSDNTTDSTTTWSWEAVSCGTNTVKYQYNYNIAPGWHETDSRSVVFTTSTEGVTYTVQVQARCYNIVTTSGWSESGSASYYRPITAPSAPAIPTGLNAYPEQDAYWSPVSCINSTASYEYYWLIEGEIDTGWIATAGTSFDISTDIQSEYSGQVEVKAKCINAGGSSPWSGTATKNYIRR